MSYRYRWTGETSVILGGHSTPEGSGVTVFPGEEFETVEEVSNPLAKQVRARGDKESKAEKADPAVAAPAPETTKPEE
jgi:hypothetical protein